jgi:hypothetical protein
MPLKETMGEKVAQQQETATPAPQQQVLSIRVTEALRYRLEYLKKVHFLQTGESVSTSEVAKQLLETARDDRLEFVKLMAEPLKSLLNERRKLESRLPLSQSEWMLVASYCQLGAEAFEECMPNQISDESLVGILEAFLAVYGLQKAKRTPKDQFYLTAKGFALDIPSSPVEGAGGITFGVSHLSGGRHERLLRAPRA